MHQTAKLTVCDEAPAPSGVLSFNSDSFELLEDGGWTEIFIERSGGSAGEASVEVSISNFGITRGFTTVPALPVTLHWADGDAAPQPILIHIVDDAVFQGMEWVTFDLGNPNGAQLGAHPSAVLKIVEDDPRLGSISFGAAEYTMHKDDGTMRISLQWNDFVTDHPLVGVAVNIDAGGVTREWSINGEKPEALTFYWGSGNKTDHYIDVRIEDTAVLGVEETLRFTLSMSASASFRALASDSSLVAPSALTTQAPGSVLSMVLVV